MSVTNTISPVPSRPAAPLDDRIALARDMIRRCTLCELRCGADRSANQPCPCQLGAETRLYKQYVSLNEELELVPSLRVFLGGCNFRCCFCDEAPGCFRTDTGRRIEPRSWASELEEALSQRAKTISLLGGEPTLHVHNILATVAAASGTLRISLNTNMYMTPEVLELFDGVVALYLADFKFGHDDCAKELAGVPRYGEVVQRNLLLAAATTKVIVRHVLIPGHLECCFRPVIDWVSTNLPSAGFHLYTGYVPCWQAANGQNIGQLNPRADVQRAVEYVHAVNPAYGVS